MKNTYLARIKWVCEMQNWGFDEFVFAIENGLVQEEIALQIKANRQRDVEGKEEG